MHAIHESKSKLPLDQIFPSRAGAASILCGLLDSREGSLSKPESNSIVLALPNGGVPVGREVAKFFSLPLDLYLVRALLVPGVEEFPMGALSFNETIIFNDSLIRALNISHSEIDKSLMRESILFERANQSLRAGQQEPPKLAGKSVILINDGIFEEMSIMAACIAIRKQTPARLVVACPVASSDSVASLQRARYVDGTKLVDDVWAVLVPREFYKVEDFYENFPDVTDEDVLEILIASTQRHEE